MDRMIGYIFGSLDTHEKVLKQVYKNLKAQKTFNRYVVCFMFVGCAYIHTNNKIVTKLEKDNKALNKRVEILEDKILGEG